MKNARFISSVLGCALAAMSFGVKSFEAQATTLRTPVKMARISQARCPAPRGVRLEVRSFFRVTNSDDGFKDNDVEVFGVVNFNGQRVWRTARDNAFTMRKFVNDNVIEVTNRTYDVIYAQPSTHKLIVTGFLNDRDKSSKDDAMWNPLSLPLIVDMKGAIEKAAVGRRANIVLAGDNNSESAELVVQITRESDIF